MRGLRGIVLIGVVVVMAVGGRVRPADGVTASAWLAPPAPTPATGQASAFFGFEIGDERHYLLGPADALEEGEAAIWMIRLERIEAAAGGRRGVFTLRHRREAPHSIENPPAPGSVVTTQVNTELTLNEHGAPLELAYTSQRDIYGVGEELFEVRYSFDKRRYRKEVSIQGAEWSYDVDLIEHAALDASSPSGLFAFVPAAASCLEWAVGARFERRLGTGDTNPRRSDADDRGASGDDVPAVEDPRVLACNELNADPAFANPGLLSFAMPALWEQRGDGQVVLFAPLRPELVRATGSRVPITFAPIIPSFPNTPGSNPFSGVLPGLDFTRLFGGARTEGDEERARDPRRYFTVAPMHLLERVRIAVGTRSSEALPLVMGSLGRAYVDDWGKVLRVDLAEARGAPARWIRLLHPNEY